MGSSGVLSAAGYGCLRRSVVICDGRRLSAMVGVRRRSASFGGV